MEVEKDGESARGHIHYIKKKQRGESQRISDYYCCLPFLFLFVFSAREKTAVRCSIQQMPPEKEIKNQPSSMSATLNHWLQNMQN